MSEVDNLLKLYNDRIEAVRQSNSELRTKINKISTSSYYGGVPDVNANRGDKSDVFAFPYNWAKTCKELSNSFYLSSILDFFRTTFNTFNYYIQPPKGNYKLTDKIQTFLDKQFSNVGGLNRILVNLGYEALKYGFTYFTSKTENKSGSPYGFNTTLVNLKDIKFYDVALTNKFIFSDDDVDEVIGVRLFSANKETANFGNDFVLDEILKGNLIQGTNITIPFEQSLGAIITYGNNYGDPIGKPFLYSTYTVNQVLEAIDNSFFKNLDNIGEHSFNFVPFTEISSDERQAVYNQVQDFIRQKGGVFISQYGKLEKIESLDAREWYEFRDALLSMIYKSKGLDVKALGLNRGATKNLAELTQTDTVLMSADIMKDFIFQLNRTFMRWFFDANFKYERLNGLCDYFTIEMEVPDKSLNQTQGNTVEMSAIRDENNANTKKLITTDNASQYTVYSDKGKPTYQVTSVKPKSFIKGQAEGNVEYIVNTSYLDNILTSSSDDLFKELYAEGKSNIANYDFIKAMIQNKKNTPAIFTKDSEDRLRLTLEDNVNKMLDVKANEILYGFKKTNMNEFADITGMSVNEWKQKELNKFMNKSGNRLVKNVIAKAEAKIKDDIRFYTDGADTTDLDNSIKQIIESDLYDYKMDNLQKISDRETINMFQDVSRLANDDVGRKANVVLIRVAVLESACDVCKPKAGRTFIKNESGQWFNPNYPYEPLPDKDCLGKKQNCNCYYVIADKDYIDTLDFANSQKQLLQGV